MSNIFIKRKTSKDGEHVNTNSKNHIIQIICCVFAIVILWAYFSNICMLSNIPSNSMSTTLQKGDITLVNLRAYTNRDIKRGDIIVFNAYNNSGESKNYVKRVIGLPGEVVSFDNNSVYINGEKLEEAYISNNIKTKNGKKNTFTVPNGKYFCLGDNREHSYDSRFWKNPYVDLSDVKGRVYFSIGLKKGFHIRLF